MEGEEYIPMFGYPSDSLQIGDVVESDKFTHKGDFEIKHVSIKPNGVNDLSLVVVIHAEHVETGNKVIATAEKFNAKEYKPIKL